MAKKHEPLPVDLTKAEVFQVGRGVALYCKRLEDLAEKNRKLDRIRDADRDQNEAEALRAEIVEPAREGAVSLYEYQQPIIMRGLKLLVTNLRSAKGTMKPLGYDDVVDELESEAARLEAVTLPKLDEQSSLPLEGESLKETADREANEAEAALAKGAAKKRGLAVEK